METHHLIAWICLAHLSVFCVFLLLKKDNRSANRMLALFMAGLAYGHLNHILVFNHIAWRIFYINELVFVIPFFMGPAFLQYTAYMTGENIRWREYLWLHLSPLVFIVPYYLSFFGDSPEFLQNYYEHSLTAQPLSNNLLIGLLTAQLTIYMLWSLRILSKTNKEVASRAELGWLRWFIKGWLIVCCVITPLLIIIASTDAEALFVLTSGISSILYFFLFVKAVSTGSRTFEIGQIRTRERVRVCQLVYEDLETEIRQISELSESLKGQLTTDNTRSLQKISDQAGWLNEKLRQWTGQLNKNQSRFPANTSH